MWLCVGGFGLLVWGGGGGGVWVRAVLVNVSAFCDFLEDVNSPLSELARGPSDMSHPHDKDNSSTRKSTPPYLSLLIG